MCGIFGLYDPQGVNEHSLIKMSDITRHRGPDDRGFFLDGDFGFGMNRLSIIDLAGGHQPIFNEKEDIVIIFNGEIYNFGEIGEELRANGHAFKTHSDTETILHAFEDKGTEVFKELRGMFGIAVWNKNNRELTLCRDRLGKKPVYYYFKNGRFAFASEIKALLELSFVAKEIDFRALDTYLSYQYIPGPLTIFKDIRKLAAGCWLRFSGGSVKIGQFWDLPPFNGEVSDEESCIAEVRRLLKESVRARLISEVPLGAFLSGGLDSSAIVALMSEAMNAPVKTFSVGFEEAGYNELEHARKVAECFNTDHHEIIVKANSAELLPKVVWHLDEPMADPAVIPTYLISEYAAKYVKVVLTGEGADEAFAGYGSFRHQKLAYTYQNRVPRVVRKLMEKFALSLLRDRRLRQGVWFYSRPEEEIGAWRIVFNPMERMGLYKEDIALELSGYDPIHIFTNIYRYGSGGFIDKMLQADTKIWLPDDLLMKVDKMSMAHSLEARAPFLDHNLVEYMARVSIDLKLRGKEGKYVLKKAMKNILPNSIIYREKHGFDLPIDRWLRDDLRSLVDDFLSPDKIGSAGIFCPKSVKNIVKKQRAGVRGYQKQVWTLLVFQLWHDRFMN